jgi:hypothetical protein
MRVDHTSDDLRVLTTAIKVGLFPNVSVRLREGIEDDEVLAETENRFAGVEIVAWHRQQGVVQVRERVSERATARARAARPECIRRRARRVRSV